MKQNLHSPRVLLGLQLLQKLSQDTYNSEDTEQILKNVVRGAIKLTKAKSGIIYLIDLKCKSVIKAFTPNKKKHSPPRLEKRDGLTYSVYKTQKTIYISDIRTDPRVNPDLLKRYKSLIAIPLKVKKRVIGVLYLNSEYLDGFDILFREFLQTLASQSAVLIQVRESEEQYSSMMNNLTQNVFKKDTKSRFTFANQTFLIGVADKIRRFKGKTLLDKLQGRTDFDIYPKELAQKYIEDDQFVLKGEIISKTEKHIIGGVEKWVKVVKNPIYNDTATKEIIGIEAIFWDVNYEMTRFDDLVDKSPDGIIIHENGYISEANKACKELFGVNSPDDLIGRYIIDLIHESDKEKAFNRLTKMLNDNTTDIESEELKVAKQYNPELYSIVTVHAKPTIKDKEIQVIFHEITTEKKQKNLLDSLADIDLLILSSEKSLYDTLKIILNKGLEILHKKNGAIILIEKNNEGKELLVVKKSTSIKQEGEVVPKKSISALAIKKDKAIYIPFIDKNNDFDKEGFDEWYIPSYDEVKDLYCTPSWGQMKSEFVVPLKFQDRIIGVINIESDKYEDFDEESLYILKNIVLAATIAIHNVKQIEEINLKNKALENSVDKNKIEMAMTLGKVIDHRIGNSSGMIRTIIKDKLLLRQDLDDKLINDLNVILINAEKVLNYRAEVKEKVNGLLFGESRAIKFKEIKQKIEHSIDLHRKNIKLFINPEFEGLQDIHANFDLIIDGVFLELIKNAIKALPNGGDIKIIGKQAGNTNVIEIIDNGCGIEHQEIDKIWINGYSKWDNDNSFSRGIGLYELKTIIEFYGGSISVKSEVLSNINVSTEIGKLKEKNNTGKNNILGTTFRITLPNNKAKYSV